MSWLLGMVNWRTSAAAIVGILINLSGFIPALAPWRDTLIQIGLAVGVGGVGFMAKDANVTGGTIPQTREAVARALNPIESAPVDPITGTPK